MRKKATLLFLLRIIKVFLGILNLSVAARYFGVSLDRDVWLLALGTILVVDLAIWGPINETFRAKFIIVREAEGETVALSKMNSLLVFCFFVSLVVTLITIFGSKTIAHLVAPGYTNVEEIKLSNMLVYIAPILLLNQLIQIGTSVLNAYDVFFVPEIASFGSTIFNIILTILLAPRYGIYSLLWAYYLGVLLLLFLILYYITKLNKNIIKKLFTSRPNTSFLPFLIFSMPFFLPYFFGQANAIVEKSLASNIFVGAIAMIDYSRKFAEMFNTVLSSVLTTMLIPVLALHFSRKETTNYVLEFERIFRFGFFAIILMVTVFTLSSASFVSIIYPNILGENAKKISKLVMYYSWSSIAVFLYIITGIALMTHGKSKIYALLGMFVQIGNILINVLAWKFFGLLIFPVSYFLTHLTSGIIMLFYFPVKKNKLSITILKLLCIFCIVISFSFLVKQILIVDNPYLQISITFLSSVLALFASLFLFKTEEVVFVKGLLKKK